MRTARGEQGFVLVTVLVALVLLALVAERLDERVRAYRDEQGGWQRWAREETELASAREDVLFALVTTQLSQGGFGRGKRLLRVDGRPYRLPSGIIASVQDARGLMPVTDPDPQMLRRFLLQRGVTDREISRLRDALADYSDTDNRHRLNGAEADRYPALGLPPPRNDWPVSPYELGLVAGWSAWPGIWTRAGDTFTGIRDGRINPNTATPAVLAALPGATAAGVEKALEWREKRLFSSAAELMAVSGIAVEEDPVNFFTGVYYRVRVWREDGAGALETQLMLTPAREAQPWLIIESRRVERPDLPAEREIPPLPLPLPVDG